SRNTNGKRVRFAEDDGGLSNSDNDIEDELEADITSGPKRRGRINADGYGSDDSVQDEVGENSDDEASDVEEGDSKSAEKNDDDDDEDMFSDNGAGPGTSTAHTAKRKRYLDSSDIEGQELSSTARFDNTDAKGKQIDIGEDEGKGGKLEAFNMKEELEDGKFDEAGNYVANKKDPQAHQDNWLEGVSSGAIEQARVSKQRQEQQQRSHAQELSVKWDSVSNDDLVIAIINSLMPRETVLSALARIGGPKKKAKKRWGKKAKGKEQEPTGEDRERKRKIEALTELADQMMGRGVVDIYDQTLEQLVRQMRVKERIPDDWQP
ncbi:hypothetical protein DL89DRAFT_209615, partial [Linderina pennispora]